MPENLEVSLTWLPHHLPSLSPIAIAVQTSGGRNRYIPIFRLLRVFHGIQYDTMYSNTIPRGIPYSKEIRIPRKIVIPVEFIVVEQGLSFKMSMYSNSVGIRDKR
jgi:hypothetical protein